MPLQFKDRVKDQTNTVGTGSVVIDGIAAGGYRTIASAYSNGASLRYTILNADGSQWEVGEGVWNSSTNTLTRATIYSSSSNGSVVNLGAGAKVVFTGPTAQDLIDVASTYAPLASPALTGTPTAPTAAADDSTTQLATTAFVTGQAGSATPQALGSAAVGTSLRYARQDHVHAMPAFSSLGGVALTSPSSADLLQYNGTNWVNWTPNYLTGNQNITVSGDASGSGATAITLTLANSGVTAGAYGSSTAVPVVTVDSKGRVTAVTTASISGSLTFTGDVTGTGATGASTALTLANSGVVAGTYTKITVDAKGRATAGTTLAASDIPSLDASKITSGVIDAARLPSFVDDVVEYANLAAFPGTGETGKIYVALDTNKTYRWSGSAYIYITSGAVDSVNGYTGVVSLTKSDVGLGNVENTALSTWAGSTAITTLGTIATGTWQGSVIGSQYGGTGVNNGGRTLTINTNSGTVAFTNASTTLTVAANASVSGTNSGDQTITLTGDVTGSGTGSFATTLANSGVSAGTYNNVTVDAKGRVTSGSNVAYITGNQNITVSGDASGSGATAITLTLANSGVTAGTYTKVTVDAKGRVTSGTTLASADLPTYTGSLTSAQVTTALGYTPYNSSNPSGYITGITSSMVTTALGYTPYDSTNPNGYITSSGSISGNAGSVTNGVYTNTSQVISGYKQFNVSNTGIANSAGNLSNIEAYGTGGAAFMGFHRPGVYAAYFGIDSDNVWKVGGWSMGAVAYPILHSANYNSYSPTLSGGGASGTWGINISGNAATASNSSLLGGLGLQSASTVIGANQIARSDGSGYVFFNYINSNTANSENPGVSQVIVTNGGDNYYRKASISHLTASLSGTAPINISGNASTATTASTANALATGNNYQMNSLGVGTGPSGTAGEIRATNNVTAYYSDDRLKTRLGVIENALAKVRALSGFYYEANETAQALGYEAVREVGLSAQETQAVLPEVVVPAPIDDKYLTIRYEKVIPLLVEAIKELDIQVSALKSAMK